MIEQYLTAFAYEARDQRVAFLILEALEIVGVVATRQIKQILTGCRFGFVVVEAIERNLGQGVVALEVFFGNYILSLTVALRSAQYRTDQVHS